MTNVPKLAGQGDRQSFPILRYGWELGTIAFLKKGKAERNGQEVPGSGASFVMDLLSVLLHNCDMHQIE